MKKALFVFAAFALSASLSFSQSNLTDTMKNENSSNKSAESGFAEDEFRRGVQSYYRGAFNESILEFEKALSYLPGEPRILDWLGKAYYRAGIEGAALQEWNYASQSGYGGVLLQNRMEIVGDRRVTDEYFGFSQKFTESGSFPNVNGKDMIYSHPISSLANPDGSIWVVSHGSNEILKFDVNGIVVARSRGAVNGLDRPMDIIRLSNGMLAVSEYEGCRISILNDHGIFQKYVGSRGVKDGQLLGPQYLAEDEFGNLYVTDFGNGRVVVYDSEGTYLLHFGQKTKDFVGLKSPTGIAIVSGRVFVADSVRGCIYEFDKSGNYIGFLVNEKVFARPESMKNWGKYLLLADSNTVYTVDSEDGSVYKNATTGSGVSQITSAVADRNGNIIVTDFKANEIYVMSKMTELIGGFFVQFERVISDNYPEVTVEVPVENRKRQPVVGLKQENFLITENKIPVKNMMLLGCADNNDIADITILIDRSISMKDYEEQVNTAVREITASMENKGKVTVVSAGAVPVTEFSGMPNQLSNFSVRALKCPYTNICSLDLAMRLSSNGLINAEKKRGIVYITAGSVGQDSFTKYSLSDLSTYMNNNAISFSTIMLSKNAPSDEISFISSNTTGSSYYVYRPEGLSGVIKDIISIPSGLYQFKYTSSFQTEYGRKYLPVEIETYLLNRSGRDETGYFAPLE